MFLYNNCCLILSLAMTCRYKSFKKQLKYIKQIKISIGNAKHNVNCKSSNTFTDSIFFSYRSCTIYQYQQNKILNKMLKTRSPMFLK